MPINFNPEKLFLALRKGASRGGSRISSQQARDKYDWDFDESTEGVWVLEAPDDGVAIWHVEDENLYIAMHPVVFELASVDPMAFSRFHAASPNSSYHSFALCGAEDIKLYREYRRDGHLYQCRVVYFAILLWKEQISHIGSLAGGADRKDFAIACEVLQAGRQLRRLIGVSPEVELTLDEEVRDLMCPYILVHDHAFYSFINESHFGATKSLSHLERPSTRQIIGEIQKRTTVSRERVKRKLGLYYKKVWTCCEACEELLKYMPSAYHNLPYYWTLKGQTLCQNWYNLWPLSPFDDPHIYRAVKKLFENRDD